MGGLPARDEAGHLPCGKSSLLPELIQDEQFIQPQDSIPALLGYETNELEACLATVQNQAHRGLGAPLAGRRWPPVPELLGVDGVDSPRRSLDNPCSLEGLSQERVSGSGRGHPVRLSDGRILQRPPGWCRGVAWGVTWGVTSGPSAHAALNVTTTDPPCSSKVGASTPCRRHSSHHVRKVEEPYGFTK
jgi:hypothetical protein